MARCFEHGLGLQTGFTDRLQIEVAEILCRQTGAEQVRFTTSGTLATMYATLLARAATGRELVMKVNGGWHGAQPWGLKGVSFSAGSGFEHLDSAGLPAALSDQVLLTRYNDPQMLEDHFRLYGDRLACFIVEPFIGGGGGIPARRDYLRLARQLTEQHGALLILDEVVSGFRFRAGDLGALYGVRPDLATFGKIIGGGMPVTAVAGRGDVMRLAGRAGGHSVKFSGGTYSAHPASMLAARTLMAYLVEHEAEIYPRLAGLGILTRDTVEKSLAEEGIYALCTGWEDDVLHGGSLIQLHLPRAEGQRIERPEEAQDAEICDHVLSERVLQLALLLEDIHTTHGLGSVSLAHSEADIALLGEACRRAARRIRPYLKTA